MTLLGIVLGNPGNPETFEPGCLAFVEIKSTDECEPADCTPYFGKMENYRRNKLVISLSKWKGSVLQALSLRITFDRSFVYSFN